MRLHRPWKVPTHMPGLLIGSIALMRASISFAALLVNVTASKLAGLAWPVWISHAMRVVSTRVLPLPAPARISADWCGSVTASSWGSLRPARNEGDDMDGVLAQRRDYRTAPLACRTKCSGRRAAGRHLNARGTTSKLWARRNPSALSISHRARRLPLWSRDWKSARDN